MFKNFKKRAKKNSLVKFFLSSSKERGVAFIPLLIIVGASIAAAYFLAPSAIKKIMGDVGLDIVAGLSYLFLIISNALFGIASNLLKGVLSSGFMQIALTKTEIVQVGFALVRDIANMGIVLGFVVVGIATILRIREYDAQKALFPLIVLAIFINFSLVFCGVIIDASNILVDYFLNKGGAKNIVFPFEDMVKNSGSAQKMDEYAAAGDQAGFAQAAFLFGLLLLITAYAFILLSIILVVRQAMLMVLLILSPLGFFCAVFKATKPAFSKWWNEFLKWSFIGVGIVFFIYLAAYLVAVGIPGVSKQTNQDQQEQLGSLAFLVPIIFLILGAKIARSSSAIGASSVLSLATGAAGFVAGKVMSATGGTIKGAYKATKESRVGQKVSRGVSAAKEKLGLTTAGATRRLGAEQAKEYAKDLEHSSDQQLAKAALSRTNAPRAAAALDKLRERKKLDMVPQNRMGTLMAKAEQFGYKREDFEKVNPNLAGIEGRGYDAVRERVRGMSTAEQKKMQNTALTPAVLSSMAPEQFKKLTPAQKDHVRQTYIHSPRGSAGKQEMKSHIRMLRGTRRTEDIPNLATNLRMASGTGTTPRGPRTRPPTPQGPGPTPPRTPPPPGGGAFRPPAPGTTQYRPRTRPPRGGGRRRGP